LLSAQNKFITVTDQCYVRIIMNATTNLGRTVSVVNSNHSLSAELWHFNQMNYGKRQQSRE